MEAAFADLTTTTHDSVPVLEKRHPLPSELQCPDSNGFSEEDYIFIPGGGIAKCLYTKWYVLIFVIKLPI